MPTVTRSIYKSQSALLRVKVRPGRRVFHPTTGDVLEEIPGVYAEFGIAGPESPFQNQLTGEMDTAADIRGGLYDLDVIGEEKVASGEWNSDTVEAVRRRLDTLCKERPSLIQRVDFITPPAPKPWPTYDDASEETILSLASDLGLLGPALAYERENQNRAELVSALEGTLGEHPDPEPGPEPVVAIPASVVVESDGYRVVV